jgi:uncharacterized protein
VYATFATVLLGIHTSIALSLYGSFSLYRGFAYVWPAFLYLHAAVYFHFGSLAWARMRPRSYRALVSVPASFFWAGTFLSLPFALFAPRFALLGYAAALLGVVQSLRHRFEEVDVVIDGAHVPVLGRHPKGSARTDRPLRLVQITDPHLGPFMSAGRLRALVERAVAQDPDLVLLTGDFVTMESHRAGPDLAHALEPLRALPGRAFACMGNHDYEAKDMVESALASAGVRLLVDAAETVQTGAGAVQVLGLDFHFRDRRASIRKAMQDHPREPDTLRLVLLHDPGAFAHLPEHEADLVLSGHTHGGQLGLLSLGLPFTAVSALSKVPDHGFWALDSRRLYVHRGTGHYGFPLRVGVPAEESLLRVHVVPTAT